MTTHRTDETRRDETNGSCERARLLISLSDDGATTPSQDAELAAHLPGCAACRRARSADRAVRERLLERTEAQRPLPADFAHRTAALAVAQGREARSQNRLLWMSAAAAVLLAMGAQLAPRDAAPAREYARAALIRHEIHESHPVREGPTREGPNREGK